jgi:hypothetical protein
MEGFDTNQFRGLMGKTGKQYKRVMEKRRLEKKMRNKEYEEIHQNQ